MSREIKALPAKVESSTSFDGKHTIEYVDGSHTYKLNGKRMVGTTTYAKAGYPTSFGLIHFEKQQALEYLWNATINRIVPLEDKDELFKAAHLAHKDKSQQAKDIGSLIHDYAYKIEAGVDVAPLEAQIAKFSEDVRTKLNNGLDKFKAWKKQNGDEIVALEALVAHVCPLHDGLDENVECLCFCGKFDRLARRGGRLILSDYKSSKDIYVDMYIQLGAYALAINRWLGLDVDGIEIVRFGKEDGEFEALLVDNKDEIEMFKRQALRCRKTYNFRKLENDPRWKYEAK